MLKGLKVGFGITGSFCTFEKILPQMKKLIDEGAEIVPIMSSSASNIDTRFGRAEDFKNQIKEITKREVVDTLVGAEPLGPNNMIDVMVIAPCTENIYD